MPILPIPEAPAPMIATCIEELRWRFKKINEESNYTQRG